MEAPQPVQSSHEAIIDHLDVRALKEALEEPIASRASARERKRVSSPVPSSEEETIGWLDTVVEKQNAPYKFVKLLAGGGGGDVFLAQVTNPDLGKKLVAIKTAIQCDTHHICGDTAEVEVRL